MDVVSNTLFVVMDRLDSYKMRYGPIFAGGTSILIVVASTLLFCSRHRKLRRKLCTCGVLLIIFTIIATLINVSPIYETHGDIVYLY